MLKILVTYTLLVLLYSNSLAQRLHARQPATLLQDYHIIGGVQLTEFKHHYFAAWRDDHVPTEIKIAFLGSDRDTMAPRINAISTPLKVSSPQLCSTDNRLFALWADDKNQLNYCSNKSDTGFNQTETYLLDNPAKINLKKGFTTAAISKGLVIAGINAKHSIWITLLQPDSAGKLSPVTDISLQIAQTDLMPSVAMIDDDVLRCCWTDRKDHRLRFADLNMAQKKWSVIKKIGNAQSAGAPLVCRPFNNRQVFYFWKAVNNTLQYIQDTNIQYGEPQTINAGIANIKNFSVSQVDHNNFMMACSNEDKGFQLVYFSNYNPTTWIADVFYPEKSHYRLADIVIPGSHDAGMSVLNGVGGRDKHYVNRCNTLTQVLNIDGQLKAGIRMFDMRVALFNGSLYTKHAPAGCMEDSKGGGWGEKLEAALTAMTTFLDSNRKEFIILNFSHFCDHPMSVKDQASMIATTLGNQYIYDLQGGNLSDVMLNQIAGKIILLFEDNSFPDLKIFASTTTSQSTAAVNFKREYAKTDNLKHLVEKEGAFFTNIAGTNGGHTNDLIRLDWQLTERSSEAALVCNVFRVERYMPIVDGLVWLTNVLERNKSILNLAVHGNKTLVPQVNRWISKKLIGRNNKPNILYVDAAGNWITDFCVELNQSTLYSN